MYRSSLWRSLFAFFSSSPRQRRLLFRIAEFCLGHEKRVLLRVITSRLFSSQLYINIFIMCNDLGEGSRCCAFYSFTGFLFTVSLYRWSEDIWGMHGLMRAKRYMRKAPVNCNPHLDRDPFDFSNAFCV